MRRAVRESGCSPEELPGRLGLFDEDCCGNCLFRLDEFDAIAKMEQQQITCEAGVTARR